MLSPGRQLAGHTLRGLIGEGPFGVVWRAVDASEQTFALKLLREGFAQRPEGKAAFQRLQQAARAHQKVQHPYVASVLGFIDERDEPALGAICSYHEGFPLEQLEVSTAARRGDDPSELSRLLFFFEELGDVLHWLHERRIVHGNLKPSNVLVQRGDFGIIPKILDLSWSAIGVAAQSENVFISPEQFAGHVPSRASDQWAFGMLIASTIGGEDLDVGGSPRSLKETLHRMRARQPDQRFGSMKEAVDGLRAVRSDLERARVLSRTSRFRAPQEGLPPVPTARTLGDGESGDLVEAPQGTASAVDDRLRGAGARRKEPSPLRLAPAALSSRDLEATDLQHLSVHAHRLKPRTPVYLGLGAALIGGALLLAVVTQSGSTVTAEATAEAQEASEPEAEIGSEAEAPSLPEAAAAAPSVEGTAPPSGQKAPPSVEEAEPEIEPAVEPAPESPPIAAPRTPVKTAPTAADCDLGAADACMEAAAWFASAGRDREARQAYESACDAGRRLACSKAVQWWAGSGMPDADRRTLLLLTKACALDGAQACHLAAQRVEMGRGVSADAQRARRLRRKACQLGREASCAQVSTSTASG